MLYRHASALTNLEMTQKIWKVSIMKFSLKSFGPFKFRTIPDVAVALSFGYPNSTTLAFGSDLIDSALHHDGHFQAIFFFFSCDFE